MRYSMYVLLLFVLACGGTDSSCTSPPQPKPAPTVTVPKPAPTATATTPKPEPKAVINWKPFSLETRDYIEKTGQCVMMYFGDSVCGDPCAYVEAVVFKDEEVVKTINDMYVAVRFPVEGNRKKIKEDLGVDEYPTFMLVFEDENSQSSVISGVGPVKDFRQAFKKNDDRYKACKAIKDKVR